MQYGLSFLDLVLNELHKPRTFLTDFFAFFILLDKIKIKFMIEQQQDRI